MLTGFPKKLSYLESCFWGPFAYDITQSVNQDTKASYNDLCKEK